MALYVWQYFTKNSTDSDLTISSSTLVFAGITIAASLAFYKFAPKKYLSEAALICFTLFTLLLSSLLSGSADPLRSPFITLWMVAAVMSGVFGLWGAGIYLALPISYAVRLYLHHQLTNSSMTILFLTTIAPVIVGYIVWHNSNKSENQKEKAYNNLANKLSQVSDKAEVIINAITDGVISVDGTGTIDLINPAAQQILGWSQQDALKLNYKSIIKLVDKAGNDVDATGDVVAKVLETNTLVTSDDITMVTNSGKKILASLYASPIGQVGSGAIIVFRDITREKAEEREQAEFISTASHEMRTPVASIEGYLGLTLNPATASIDDKARNFITKAHESAQHLGRLFQDLLDVSKADDGRLQNDPKVINVVEYLYDIVEGLQPKAKEKNLQLIYKPQPDNMPRLERGDRGERNLTPIFYINADPDHLREVVANLVENGIKYTPSGQVVVDVTGDDENVQISVTDSGIGIPPEDIGHLFQKFYRVDNSETREIGGTGLGLYLSRRLTETMNGRIWVESEYKHGSTFFLGFPRLDSNDAARLIEQSAQQAAAAPPAIVLEHPITPQAPVEPAPAPPVAPAPVAPPAATAPSPAPNSMPPIYTPPSAQPATTPPSDPGNTPLSVIEQNKSAYVTRRPYLNVPTRSDEE